MTLDLERKKTDEALRRMVPVEGDTWGYTVERHTPVARSKDVVIISTPGPRYSYTIDFTARGYRPGWGAVYGQIMRSGSGRYRGAGWRDRLISDTVDQLKLLTIARLIP